ncbi:MAG: type II CAAX endopeptidase family protein [Clostridia bacterium]|nr:type II CAAX endopeptidase family protein [Clostridia bacterium]
MQKNYSYGNIRSDIYNENSNKNNEPLQFRQSPLKKFALATGLTIFAYILASELIGYFAAGNEAIIDLYKNNYYFRTSFTVIMSLLMILVPFFVLFLITGRKDRTVLRVFEKKPPLNLLPFIIIIGFAVIFISNYATTLITMWLKPFGIVAQAPTGEQNLSGASMILFELFGTAVVPAVIEEFAIRGVLLQWLRKYGDTFAIIASSVVFGLMHMNFVQFIFATLLGIFMSYVVIQTESIWTGIAIHFCNNAYSVLMSVVSQRMPEEKYTSLFLVLVFAIMIGAIISLVVLSKHSKEFKPLKNPGKTKSLKASYRKLAMKTYLLHPILFIAILLMIYNMKSSITFNF